MLLSLCKCVCAAPRAGVSCGRLLVLVQQGTRFIRAVHSLSKPWILLTLVEGREIGLTNFTNTKKKGKSNCDNVYCKVVLGDQEQSTDVATDNVINGNAPVLNGVPQIPTLVWNYSMQFLLKNINEETLIIVVYEMCPFQPDEFMGRAELRIADIYQEARNTNGPITKKLILHQVESGEIIVKVDIQMFTNDY